MVNIPEINWPERPEQIPEEVWEILPAFPFEYPDFPCSILPLPRILLDKICPLVAPPGADIRLSGLVISPSEIQIGQAVLISCTAENIGSETGTKAIICKVDGATMAEQTVTLAPGDSQVISFQVTPTVAKTYSVAVNGLTGSFKATVTPPPGVADIRVENLTISPIEVMVGEVVTISIVATNYGTAAGTKVIECLVS